MKIVINIVIIFGILLAGIYFILNSFAYFDPSSLCFINIDGSVLSGNEKTIKSALRKIKKEDKISYATVCQYVTIIGEKLCYAADPNINAQRADQGWKSPGCYVKGSKAIYLLPQKDDSENIVQQRAEAIIKYGTLSKNFWEELE